MKASRTIVGGLVALVAALLLLVVGANMWKSGLVVTKVMIVGNRVVNANEILQLAHVKAGTKMYDLDLMVIRRDVVSHHFLKDVTVERDLPSTLKITVVERTPIAMVNGKDVLYLDADGVVLPHSVSDELFDLPMISNIARGVDLSLGAVVENEDVSEALAILSTARVVNKELYHLISEIRLRDGGDLVFYMADGGVPVLYGRGGAAAKLVRLETFWNTVVRERGAQNLNYIDLRYEDQVVARWNSAVRTSHTL